MSKLGILVLSVLLSACSWVNTQLGLPDDNLGEGITEKLIEWKTGIDIDLTPNSKELHGKF